MREKIDQINNDVIMVVALKRHFETIYLILTLSLIKKFFFKLNRWYKMGTILNKISLLSASWKWIRQTTEFSFGFHNLVFSSWRLIATLHLSFRLSDFWKFMPPYSLQQGTQHYFKIFIKAKVHTPVICQER